MAMAMGGGREDEDGILNSKEPKWNGMEWRREGRKEGAPSSGLLAGCLGREDK